MCIGVLDVRAHSLSCDLMVKRGNPRWDFYLTKREPTGLFWKERTDTLSFIPVIASTSGRLHIELVFLFYHRHIGNRFFKTSGVQLPQSTSGQFHDRRSVFSSEFKSKVGNILTKDEPLRISLNIDDKPITSKSHTHPSHSTSSRLLTSSPLDIPVPNGTQSLSHFIINKVLFLKVDYLMRRCCCHGNRAPGRFVENRRVFKNLGG
jgi:hypothetical protein